MPFLTLTPAQRQAQELAWQAMDCQDDPTRCAALCEEALRLDPECIDAIILQAELQPLRVYQYLAIMEQAVLAGRRRLGPAFFKEHRGYFWDILETRPFMRAMACLAEALTQPGTADHLARAAELFEEMLSLNPGDPQGVRHPLLSCYLQLRAYERAGKLLDRFEDGDDTHAIANWGEVLLMLACDHADSPEIQHQIEHARTHNPHVEIFLSGRKHLPRNPVGTYSRGDYSEAVFCGQVLAPAWAKHPKAKKWIKTYLLENAEHAGGEGASS